MGDNLAAPQISEALKSVPWSSWVSVVGRAPEFRQMEILSKRYSPGAFLTLMVIAGLNDYQLKGKAEEAYWPPLRSLLEGSPTPGHPADLYRILEPFYRKERLPTAKVARLSRFLESPLAEELWTMSSSDVSKQLRTVWERVANTMGQAPKKKTVVFSLKTLGIGLLWLGEDGFDFDGIPVPVDSRLERLTPGLSEDEIRSFWDEVLAELKKTESRLTHIHLDSLLWQYAGEDQPRVFLEQLGVPFPEKVMKGFRNLCDSTKRQD